MCNNDIQVSMDQNKMLKIQVTQHVSEEIKLNLGKQYGPEEIEQNLGEEDGPKVDEQNLDERIGLQKC